MMCYRPLRRGLAKHFRSRVRLLLLLLLTPESVHEPWTPTPSKHPTHTHSGGTHGKPEPHSRLAPYLTAHPSLRLGGRHQQHTFPARRADLPARRITSSSARAVPEALDPTGQKCGWALMLSSLAPAAGYTRSSRQHRTSGRHLTKYAQTRRGDTATSAPVSCASQALG